MAKTRVLAVAIEGIWEGSPLELTNQEIWEFILTLEKPLYTSTRQSRLVKLLLMRMNEFDSIESRARYADLYIEADLSVEHVAPQKPDNDAWEHLLKERRKYDEMVNKLGNLILLSGRKNSAAKNLGFKEKKEKIFSRLHRLGATNNIPLTDSLNEIKEWTFEVQEKRQREAVGLCRQIWQLYSSKASNPEVC